jgi:hypothetical protein
MVTGAAPVPAVGWEEAGNVAESPAKNDLTRVVNDPLDDAAGGGADEAVEVAAGVELPPRPNDEQPPSANASPQMAIRKSRRRAPPRQVSTSIIRIPRP